MTGGGLALSRARSWLFGAKALRAFAFGWLSVILALYLAGCGMSPKAIGAVFTATIVEDALLTMVLSAAAVRLGAARVMLLTAPRSPWAASCWRSRPAARGCWPAPCKIAYDLALSFRFRSVRLDDSDGALSARRGGVTPPGT